MYFSKWGRSELVFMSSESEIGGADNFVSRIAIRVVVAASTLILLGSRLKEVLQQRLGADGDYF